MKGSSYERFQVRYILVQRGTIALDDTDDDSRRASEELGFNLGRRPGGAMAATVDEI